MTISVTKKRYSLALTMTTMETLQEQLVKVGVKTPRQAAGLITLMVDDFLHQMSEHVLPVIIEAKKTGKGDVSQVAFMKMLFEAMTEIQK